MTDNKAEAKIQSAKGFVPRTAGRKSPAQVYIEEQGDGYYTIRDTSEICGVHIESVRRLLRTDKVDAPSSVLTRGGMHIWLLTEDDLVEVSEYFGVEDRVTEYLKGQKK